MRRNVLFAGLLIAGLLALNGCGGKDEAAAAGAGGPPGGMQLPVETVTVQPQALVAGLQTVGSLRADELVVVRPEVAGRISRIHFTEGGRVVCAATPCNKVPLSPGAHTLSVENPEQGLKQTTTVIIKSGEITTRAIGLK